MTQHERQLGESNRYRMLRMVAAQAADEHGIRSKLFLNTHFEEIIDPETLVKSVEELKTEHPDLNLVIEIHESTVSDLTQMTFGFSREMRRLANEGEHRQEALSKETVHRHGFVSTMTTRCRNFSCWPESRFL